MHDDYQNPFDNDTHQFLVLINSQKQHSLWPNFAEVPAGWKSIFGPQSRQQCADYIEKNWHDLS